MLCYNIVVEFWLFFIIKMKDVFKMKLSRKEQWIAFGLVNGFLLLLPFLFAIYDEFLRPLPSFSDCLVLKHLHLYCVGCGGTRSFEALCRFDILESIKYHPFLVYIAGGLIVYEFVMIKSLIKKEERKVFFSLPAVIIFMVLLILYAIVRNVLLFYGIDLLGNVIIS